MTDAGLEHLKGMTDLTDRLGLCNTGTDAGLRHLRAFTKLCLNLHRTAVTRDGSRV